MSEDKKYSSVAERMDYVEVCRLASENEEYFSNFKRNERYRDVLEHVNYQLGWQYLEYTNYFYPWLMPYINKFKENDLYGNPILENYGGIIGNISPSTLRYTKVLGDLVHEFGSLKNMDIIEIGGGYGGQSKLINDYCGFKSYTDIDLKPALNLTKKYLVEKFNITNINFYTYDNIPDKSSWDLVISNYAFSECNREIQELYFNQILSKSIKGYITFNYVTDPNFNAVKLDDMLERIPGIRIKPEGPKEAAGKSMVLTWGASVCPL